MPRLKFVLQKVLPFIQFCFILNRKYNNKSVVLLLMISERWAITSVISVFWIGGISEKKLNEMKNDSIYIKGT